MTSDLNRHDSTLENKDINTELLIKLIYANCSLKQLIYVAILVDLDPN